MSKRHPRHNFTLTIRGIQIEAVVDGDKQDHEVEDCPVLTALEARITPDEIYQAIQERFAEMEFDSETE